MHDSNDKKPIVEYSSDALNFFSDRHATTYASFLMPFLNQGMTVLDCGCGPGTITLDLAEFVYPGDVTGINIAPTQIKTEKTLQSQRKIQNVRFEIGDVNALEFPDESLDIVFAHGVIEYLEDPVHAFKEIRRVLTNDGK